MITLEGDDLVRRRVKDHLDSREWWMVVASHQNNNLFPYEQVEDRFYSGEESSADFEMFIHPRFVIMMFHKRRMTEIDLASVMKERGCMESITPEILKTQDCLFITDAAVESDADRTLELAHSIDLWLHRKRGYG